jgi:hypothetical protein
MTIKEQVHMIANWKNTRRELVVAVDLVEKLRLRLCEDMHGDFAAHFGEDSDRARPWVQRLNDILRSNELELVDKLAAYFFHQELHVIRRQRPLSLPLPLPQPLPLPLPIGPQVTGTSLVAASKF